MADTSAQVKAEKWVRQFGLTERYGKHFEKRVMRLRGNGEFSFDAVSEDGEIVACISTSGGVTAGGKKATAKLLKIRSDVLWFYMLPKMPTNALLVFTDEQFMKLVMTEREKGRFPTEFELVNISLPEDLAREVADSQQNASDEVRPRHGLEH
jgi:hypothetical protein